MALMQQKKVVLWQAIQWDGVEHLTLKYIHNGLAIDSYLHGVIDERPFAFRYRLKLDSCWQVRMIEVDDLSSERLLLYLQTDGKGNWQNAQSAPIEHLNGCRDIDISLSPFTNTLPIRRLMLTTAQLIKVVYIDLPSFQVNPVEQWYIQSAPNLYHYEQPAINFAVDLSTDCDGLVIDYPELYRRIYPK